MMMTDSRRLFIENFASSSKMNWRREPRRDVYSCNANPDTAAVLEEMTEGNGSDIAVLLTWEWKIIRNSLDSLV